MTTLHGIFRKLLLRNIPALTDEDLDAYDSLLALRLELIHQRDLMPKDIAVELSSSKNPKFNRLHDYYPLKDGALALPGRVALNVLGARIFTYIHEFAHAMCSVFHGEIVDEYTDSYVRENYLNQNGNADDVLPWHSINRIQKDPTLLHNGHIIGVHKEFATYNCTRFQSDLDHPSAGADWFSYYPERTPRGLTCAMDRGTGFNHFDPLISAFMYDRILAKLNRKKLQKKRGKSITVTETKKADSDVKSRLIALGGKFKTTIGAFFYKLHKDTWGRLPISTTRPSDVEIKTPEVEAPKTIEEETQSTKEKLDELIKDTTEAAHQIIEPHRTKFKALHQLWMARRQLAFQQEDILQIPTTLGRVWGLTTAFLKYKWVQFTTFIIISWESGKGFIKFVTIVWDRIIDMLLPRLGQRRPENKTSFQKS